MLVISKKERAVMDFILALLLDKEEGAWWLRADNLDEYSKKEFEAEDHFTIDQVGVGTGVELKLKNDTLAYEDEGKYLVVYETFCGEWSTTKALRDYNITWKLSTSELHNQLMKKVKRIEN